MLETKELSVLHLLNSFQQRKKTSKDQSWAFDKINICPRQQHVLYNWLLELWSQCVPGKKGQARGTCYIIFFVVWSDAKSTRYTYDSKNMQNKLTEHTCSAKPLQPQCIATLKWTWTQVFWTQIWFRAGTKWRWKLVLHLTL